MEKRIITCVYCGMEYPQGTPTSGDKILTDHIKICEKHPMREAEKKIEILRNALMDLIGKHNIEELNEFKKIIEKLIDSRIKTVSINAINALIETGSHIKK